MKLRQPPERALKAEVKVVSQSLDIYFYLAIVIEWCACCWIVLFRAWSWPTC